MRYAVYFTPPMSEPLARAAAHWLGRDAFSGADVPTPAHCGLDAAERDALTVLPRRYGFHATLKAPFELAAGCDEPDLLSAVMRHATTIAPFELANLQISRIGKFFALTLSEPCEAMQSLADGVVTSLEPFRAPLSQADIERRRPERLDERQRDYLHAWGYPYVFEEFTFHMTLTGPVAETQSSRVEKALEAFFSPVLGEPIAVDSIALFTEVERGCPFVVNSLHPLGRMAGRKGKQDRRQA